MTNEDRENLLFQHSSSKDKPLLSRLKNFLQL